MTNDLVFRGEPVMIEPPVPNRTKSAPEFVAPPARSSLSQRVLIIAAAIKESRETFIPLAKTDAGRAAIERAIENLEGVVIRAVAGMAPREKKSIHVEL